MSKDGTTPFDLGPLARGINLSCPDVSGEPKQVVVRGRVRGIVEIGTEEEGGEINLHSFRSSLGSAHLSTCKARLRD